MGNVLEVLDRELPGLPVNGGSGFNTGLSVNGILGGNGCSGRSRGVIPGSGSWDLLANVIPGSGSRGLFANGPNGDQVDCNIM